MPRAKVAVDIFIVMSGFLMVHVSTKRLGGKGYDFQSTIEFYVRRFFRISPVYYLALGLIFLFHDQIERWIYELQSRNINTWSHGAH